MGSQKTPKPPAGKSGSWCRLRSNTLDDSQMFHKPRTCWEIWELVQTQIQQRGVRACQVQRAGNPWSEAALVAGPRQPSNNCIDRCWTTGYQMDVRASQGTSARWTRTTKAAAQVKDVLAHEQFSSLSHHC